MNLKLDLVRLANKDVIATSTTLCSHLNAIRNGEANKDHIYVTNLVGPWYKATTYTHGDNLIHEGDNFPFSSDAFVSTPEINTWYYWNGTAYAKCEEQSNDAHPENPR